MKPQDKARQLRPFIIKAAASLDGPERRSTWFPRSAPVPRMHTSGTTKAGGSSGADNDFGGAAL